MSTATVATTTFMKAYWVTMRPYLLFVSGITGLAGMSFAPALSWSETCVLFLVFFFSYGLGQALTDCFQTDTDAISSPYRPLVKGVISKRSVLIVSLVNLAVCGGVLGWFALLGLCLAALCVFGLATYTYFKRRWWGGPFYNGWIVAVLFLIGYVSGLRNADPLVSPQLLLTVVTVLFGYANFVLVGYFKDIAADRATGYNTLPVMFGRTAAAVVSDVFAIVFCSTGCAAFVTGLHEALSRSTAIAYLCMTASIAATILTQTRLHSTTTDGSAHKAVSPSVHAYVLMLCGIVAANRPEWAVAIVAFYMGFVYTLAVRPERSQI